MTAHFHGPDLTPADEQRLTRLLDRVRDYMLRSDWVTLDQVAAACGCGEPSASARLRDLRKSENGGYIIERRKHERLAGVFLYRLRVPPPPVVEQRELFGVAQ